MSRRLVLQNFLPYLLNRAGMRIGTMFSRDIEPYGITLPMWRVLIELWHKGEHRLGELADLTSIDISTLSRLLVTMQRDRLVVRRRSGLDGRALSLTLTERGLELVEKITPFALYYERQAIKSLNHKEIAQLKLLLRKVFANLEVTNRAKGLTKSVTREKSKAQSGRPQHRKSSLPA
jgi:MarR family transcriptional regulator, organic hydroperoxide resistance regulator